MAIIRSLAFISKPVLVNALAHQEANAHQQSPGKAGSNKFRKPCFHGSFVYSFSILV